MNVVLNRQKLGIEDLEWGTGTVNQTRGGQQVTVTQINASNLPFDDAKVLQEVYTEMQPLLGNSEAIIAVANDIAKVVAVGDNIPNIDIVASHSSDIVAIATSIVPNLAELLQADDNAALVSNLYDQFDDRYLGSKAVEPTVDNDGDVLLVGALYFDSVLNKMREWNGTQWQDSLTLTAGSISTLTNKSVDDISNTIGADHIHYKARNASGATIPVGTVVTAMGTQPGTDYIQVVPVTDPQTQVAIGMIHTELLNNGVGLCVSRGVQDNTNTSAWAVGTILYPNTTGGLTTVKPASGMYQACAYVLRQHASSGTLLVNFIEPKTIASTTIAGEVMLNDTLTSTSTIQALTANQGKVLNDRLIVVESSTVQEGDNVTLTGDVTGTATFDANGDVSVEVTVVDDSHNHVISNVDGLQIALDSKVDENVAIVAGTATKITYDAKGLVTAGAVLDAADIPSLDASKITTGIIDPARLPSYVDDVLEYTDLAAFPVTGAAGVIYIALDTNKAYRWSGTVYVYITSGAVDSVAGKTGVVTLAKEDVGLDNVDNTSDVNKPVSTATQTALNLKSNTSTTVEKDSSTGAAYIPSGTTAQRPVAPTAGYTRFNTDLVTMELWNGTSWTGVGGAGATGGGTDNVFVENEYVITTNYTIPAGKSALSVGDGSGNITIQDGVTVTFGDANSRWIIL